MTQPTAYTRSTAFAEDEASNVGGRSTVRTGRVDAELDAIALTIAQIRANLALIQRDDTALRDGVVDLHTLSSAVLALLASYGSTVRGEWATATAYAAKDLVTEGGTTYICVTAHTSGTFATDLAAVKWLMFSLGSSPGASSVAFTPTATIAATTVQAAIEEADTENRALSSAAAAVGTNLADSSDVAKGDALVAVKRSYTGAVALTGHLWHEAQAVCGAEFGIVGDGTDIAPELLSALTNGELTNPYGTFKRQINLGAGYFLQSATVAVPAGSDIVGEGCTSTQLHGAGFPLASGDPLLTYTNAPDWRMSGLRLEGDSKTSGVTLTNSYFGVADQCHFNSMKGHGVKLIEAAQSVFRSCSFYYYTAAGDRAILLEGGSMTAVTHCNFDTQSVGIESSTSGLGSGVRVWGSGFGAQYPAFKIGNGESLWDLTGNYFEGTPGNAAADVISIGTFNGGGGSAKTNLIFSRNQVAGTLVNDMTFFQAGTLNFHGNELGVNVTVGPDVTWLYATGNAFAAGKSLTNNAQFTTVEERNRRLMASTDANASRVDSIDNTLKVWTEALNRALSAYVQKVVDALNFDWRLSGSATNKMSLVAAGHLQVPSSVRPGALGAAPAQQTATGHWGGTGAPNNAYGQNGDFYFRSDGGALTTIYHKRAGSWVGVV